MAIYIGTNRVTGMYLGTTRVTAAYLGTELIYTEDAGVWTLYYDGAVPEVTWAYSAAANDDYTHLPSSGADLIIPRPCDETGYSSRYIATYAARDTGTYMYVQASGPNSNRTYVASAVTAQPVTVPIGATALTMEWQLTAGTSPAAATASLGLYPTGTGPIYADSTIAPDVGVWATLQGISKPGKGTFSLALPSSMWGDHYYVAVSCCGKADTSKQLRVKRLYFTE